MIGSGLTRFSNDTFCAWDCEGEGLSLGFARPWQVAWGLATIKSGLDPASIKMRYIRWPDLRISPDTARITRFDPVTYNREARPPCEVLGEFNADLYSPAHRGLFQNGLGYDVYVHANWMRACGLKPDFSYLLRSVDTHAILKARKKGWQPDISSPAAFLRWQYQAVGYIEKGLKTNLTEVGQEMGITHDYATTHDAASDIALMAKVWQKAVYEVEV